ncbi:hypothetical protein LINGRAHAP2_LOCUS10142 [Linum grandiflorum]
MAEQRQFRFRLPWLSAPATPPRPTPQTEPTRPPTTEIRAPPQPTTTISTQRPPFRPAGIAPPPPPPPTPQPSSPVRTPQPSSPVRTPRSTSIPPSPSRTVTRSLLSEARPASPTLPPPQKPELKLMEDNIATSKSDPEIAKPANAGSTRFGEPESKRDENIKREGKTDVSTSQGTLRNRVAQLLSSATQPREPVSMAEQLMQEDRKKPPTSTGSGDEKIKGVSSTSHTRTNGGEQVPFHREIKQEVSKLVQKLGQGHTKQPMGDQPVSVLTLAGENRGATMHFQGEPERKDGSLHIHRGYKTNPDDSTTDGEGIHKGKRSTRNDDEQPPTMAYVNSNSQSINNSILLDSNVNERNPGVHLFLPHIITQPDSNESAANEEHKTQRSEVSVTPAQKLTYEPRLRRRCLRGLLLETSDSDPDNPDKPRRHGCRYYACKDKDIGLL